MQPVKEIRIHTSEGGAKCPFRERTGGCSWLGLTWEFVRSRDLLDFVGQQVLNSQDRFYDAVRVPVGHRSLSIVTNPVLIRRLLRSYRDNEDEYSRSDEFKSLAEKGIGDFSPLTSKGSACHALLRKAYKNSTFLEKSVKQRTPEIVTIALEFVATVFKSGGEYQVPSLLFEYTVRQAFDNLIRSEKKFDFSRVAQVIEKVGALIGDEIQLKLKSFWPGNSEAFEEFNDIAKQVVDSESVGLVNAIKNLKLEKTDFPGYSKDQRAKIKEEMVLSAAKTAMLIASSTTQSLSVSCLRCLAENPEAQEALYNALKGIDLSNDNGEELYEALHKCTELVHFVHEVLRLYSPVLALARKANIDMNLVGPDNEGKAQFLGVPEGGGLLLSVYHAHRYPGVWGDNPEEFNPSRFKNQNIKMKNLLSFSSGSTRCVGEHYGLTVVYAFLCGILKKYSVRQPAFPQDLSIVSGISLRFEDELKVVLEPRDVEEQLFDKQNVGKNSIK